MPGCRSLPPPKCLPWKLPPGANVPLSIPLWLDDRKDIQTTKKPVPHVWKGSVLEQMEEEKRGESFVVGSAGKCLLNWRWRWVLKVPGGDDGWLWWWRYLEVMVIGCDGEGIWRRRCFGWTAETDSLRNIFHWFLASCCTALKSCCRPLRCRQSLNDKWRWSVWRLGLYLLQGRDAVVVISCTRWQYSVCCEWGRCQTFCRMV